MSAGAERAPTAEGGTVRSGWNYQALGANVRHVGPAAIEAQAREIADLRIRVAEIELLRAEVRAMRQLLASGTAR